MPNILFITTKKLKENTSIDDNVSDDILIPHIYSAQQTHIHQILGTNLYELIKSEVRTGSLSTANETLLEEYIQPALIQWATYEALPFISLKLNNKSIGRGTAEYLAEGNLEDLRYLRNSVRDLAEFYSQRLTGYIKENVSDYPTYQTNSGLDKIIPNSGSFFGGVYLGNGRSKSCDWGLGDKWIDIN